MPGLRLGAELGGTWLRLCLCGDDGRVLRRGRFTGGPWPGAPAMLRAALTRWGNPKLDALVLGGKGLWAEAPRRRLAKELRRMARRVTLMSDLELSHRAAFAGGPGVLLLAGTGTAALGRDARGRLRRAGGWGPLLGDEGSAFWLGKEALKDPSLRTLWPADKALRVAGAPLPVRETARLARVVLQRARRGDRAAAALRTRAAAEIAALALDASRGLPRPVPLVLHGGLFADEALRRETLKRLRGFRVVPAAMKPEVAAARILKD
jgi:N-acetylglucosamine kinase-like BadF-type ATPase